MTLGNLLPQNVSGELDGRCSVSDHCDARRHIAEYRDSVSGMSDVSNDAHLPVACVFEQSPCYVNVLDDAYGIHQIEIPHRHYPKQTTYPRLIETLRSRSRNTILPFAHYGFRCGCMSGTRRSACKSTLSFNSESWNFGSRVERDSSLIAGNFRVPATRSRRASRHSSTQPLSTPSEGLST